MAYAAGFSLDLYCDNRAGHPLGGGEAQFVGWTWAECARDARAKGWKLDRQSRAALCPRCKRAGVVLDTSVRHD